MNNRDEYGEEFPHNHLIQILLFVIYLMIWIPDSLIFHFTTFLTNTIPFLLHVTIGAIIFVIGLVLMELAHRELFEKKLSGLITTGILSHTRHPMYFGTILAYLGGIIGTLSLITLIPWLLSVILYYKMATYEEQKLEEKYGQEYLEYKKKVPKWISR